MNAPFFPDRTTVHATLTMLGERHGLQIVDLLPTGCVGHPADPQPVVFLAEKTRANLSLIELGAAETELQDALGYAVRILMRTELEASSSGRAILREVRGL